ncbi:MAG: sulfotransferase [Pseudomonadota bacterium]
MNAQCETPFSENTQIMDERLLHIVGMYKSGTSWLSHVLASHPQVVGWDEFDPLKMAFKEERWEDPPEPTRLQRLITRLVGLRSNAFEHIPDVTMAPMSPTEVFEGFFVGQGWLPLRGEGKREQAARIDSSCSCRFLDEFLKLADTSIWKEFTKHMDPATVDFALDYRHAGKRSLVRLMDLVRSSEDPSVSVRAFYDYLQSQVPPGTFTAVKAANQIQRIPLLHSICPNSRKIAIVRDARDVAVSASKYQQLMVTLDVPWKEEKERYEKRLTGWSRRIRLLMKYQKAYGLIVLRYEDLKADFAGVTGRLFEQLGLHVSEALLNDVERKTSFETVSGGREPGKEATHQIRKGVVGDWRSVFSEQDSQLAWELAGAELAYLGYTPSGELKAPPKQFLTSC